ncbi:MAG: helicase-associated domain-containing protein [Caldilinea sp.]
MTTSSSTALLNTYHVDTLFELVEANGLNASPGKKKPLKGDLLALLLGQLFTAERVRASYAALGEPERTVLNYLLYRGGSMRKDALARDLVRGGVVQPIDRRVRQYSTEVLYAPEERGAQSAPGSLKFQDVLARLTRLGLVFSSHLEWMPLPYALTLHPAAVILVPPAVWAHLPKVNESPITLQPPQPKQTQQHSPLLRNLLVYWEYLRQNPLPLLRSGYLGKRAIRAINQILLDPDQAVNHADSEGDVPMLLNLRCWLTSLKLVEQSEDKLVAVTEPNHLMPPFWTLSTRAQQLTLLRILIKVRLSGASPSREPFWAIDPQQGLEGLLRVLLDVGTSWQDVKDLAQLAHARDAGFLVPPFAQLGPQQAVNVYLGGNFIRNRGHLIDAMTVLEESFVHEMTTGPLFQLGLVELGDWSSANSKEDVLIRLTEQGRQTLQDLADAYPAEADLAENSQDQGRIVVQPNFHVLALGPVPTRLLVRLGLCAKRTKADHHVFEYTLTRESIYAAQQAGLVTDAVIQWLEEAAGGALPQNVRRSLWEWGQHHERIVFRPDVSLLQTKDAAQLERLLADPAVSSQLERTLAPSIALLRPQAVRALSDTLLAQGILPALTYADP